MTTTAPDLGKATEPAGARRGGLMSSTGLYLATGVAAVLFLIPSLHFFAAMATITFINGWNTFL